nr:hypothetical protein [Nitrospirota bacterium]
MGYDSDVRGSVRMSEARFHQLLEASAKLPTFSEPQTLENFFEEVSYEEGCCVINSYGRHYDLEYMVELISRFKEGDTVDEVIYQGDSGIEDSGTFFILPGTWAFVSVRYPIIEDVKEGDWVNARPTDAQVEMKSHS